MGRWHMKERCFELIRLVTQCLLLSSRISVFSKPLADISGIHQQFDAVKGMLVVLRDTLEVAAHMEDRPAHHQPVEQAA